MFHRFSSVSDGVWSVLENTANAARNTLKVPPIWEWKVTAPRKERLGKYSKKKPLQGTGNDDSFPYSGDWKTGARYRYYYRTAPVGPGFVAVGGMDENIAENKNAISLSPDLVTLGRRTKRLGQALIVTNPDEMSGPDGDSHLLSTTVRSASVPPATATNLASLEGEEGLGTELECLLGPYGSF